MTEGTVDKATFGVWVAVELPDSTPTFNALPGFSLTLVTIFLPRLADVFPNFSEKIPTFSILCVINLFSSLDFFSIA